MKHLKRYTIIGTIFVLITGSLAHFLYDWSGHNEIVGLFTPINESIWEHMKLLFFPMLLYAIFLIIKYKKRYSCITSSLCFGILTGTILIPFLFYAYITILDKDFFILDISIFILSILIAFWLTYKLTLSCRLEPFTFLLCFSVGVLFLCFVWFTYHAPAARIFEDPAVSQSTGVTRSDQRNTHFQKSVLLTYNPPATHIFVDPTVSQGLMNQTVMCPVK